MLFWIILLSYILSTLIIYKLMSILMKDEVYSNSDKYLILGFASLPIVSLLLLIVFAIMAIKDKCNLVFKKIGSFTIFLPKKIISFIMHLIDVIPPNTKYKEKE